MLRRSLANRRELGLLPGDPTHGGGGGWRDGGRDHVCICIYVYVYMHMYMYMYIYIYTNIYIYIYMHVYTSRYQNFSY